jgi:hypothetical protein
LHFTAGYENIAHYSAYSNNYSRKPTCFLSNVKMNLKVIKNGALSMKKINSNTYQLILSGACRDNKKDNLKRERAEIKLSKLLGHHINVMLKYKKNAMERSSIPNTLILNLLNIFINFKGRDFNDMCYKNNFPLTP